MKRVLNFSVLLTGLFLLTGCPQDVDILPENNEQEGTWYLRNVNGGFAGVNIDYSQNEVKWTFESSDSTLEVVNNIISTGPESIHSGPESGTYAYSIQVIDGSERLFIDSENKGTILIQNDSLFLDEGVAADGFMSVFVR